jgi:hypothetical protein
MGKFTILFFCLLIFNKVEQSDINFAPKALFREFKKVSGTELTIYSEIPMADSMVQKYRIEGKYFTCNQEGSPVRYFYIGRVNSCRVEGCSVSNVSGMDENLEYFDYFIFFDQWQRVIIVNVYNYAATHGQEITARGWLKQFLGYDVTKNLEVGKNIDGISGATISVYGITADIQHKTAILNSIDQKP